MLSRFSLLTSTFLVGCAVTAAQAQPPEFGRGGGRMRMMPVIAALDADGNGVISAEEILQSTAALQSLDKNEDGQLTEEEMLPNFGGQGFGGPGGQAGRGGPEGRGGREGMGERGGPSGEPAESVVARLMVMDKDGDGKLSQTELSGRMQAIMTKADTNKDGFVTKAEIEAMAAADATNGAGREGRGGREGFGGPGSGGPGFGGPGFGGQGGQPDPTQMVSRAMQYDVDKDGKLSGEELAKLFAEMGPGQGRGGPGGRPEIRRPE